MFTDESHFLVRGKHSQFVRKSAGEMLTSHHINESVKHPPKKMFWGGFTWKGVDSLVPIEGMMNTDKYIDVLKRRAFRDLKRAFPGENRIFPWNFSARLGTLPLLQKNCQVFSGKPSFSTGLAGELPGFKSN